MCPREAETGFPPSEKPAEAGRGVSGASRGEFGSRAGLWHEAEPRAERWRREIYCKVQHLSSAVQRPPPPRLRSCESVSLWQLQTCCSQSCCTTDAQFIRQSVRLQSNLWPDLTSFWTQSVTFFHLYGHKVSHMKIFPFIHSFVYLNTLFPTFVLIKVSAFCPVSIFWTECGFLFLFSSNTILNI